MRLVDVMAGGGGVDNSLAPNNSPRELEHGCCVLFVIVTWMMSMK